MTVDRTKPIQRLVDIGFPELSAHCRSMIFRQSKEGVTSGLGFCRQSNTSAAPPKHGPLRNGDAIFGPRLHLECLPKRRLDPAAETGNPCIDRHLASPVSSRASPMPLGLRAASPTLLDLVGNAVSLAWGTSWIRAPIRSFRRMLSGSSSKTYARECWASSGIRLRITRDQNAVASHQTARE